MKTHKLLNQNRPETQESASIIELEDNNELVSVENEANGVANEVANEAKSITIPEPDKKGEKEED